MVHPAELPNRSQHCSRSSQRQGYGHQRFKCSGGTNIYCWCWFTFTFFHVFYCFFVSRFGGSRCRWGQKWSAMRFSTAWLQSRILIRFAAISKLLLGGTVFFCEKAHSQLYSNQWQRKTVGMTTSIDLLNLERHAQVVLNMMMMIELHIDERKIQLS